mmetsp:Transcript_53788/g.107877  ORF Transcript_53788/g.107877 Transcript_53788/m.107877 type:complete len:112 (+) Transcript_53788:308-643(+)
MMRKLLMEARMAGQTSSRNRTMAVTQRRGRRRKRSEHYDLLSHGLQLESLDHQTPDLLARAGDLHVVLVCFFSKPLTATPCSSPPECSTRASVTTLFLTRGSKPGRTECQP